MFDKNADDDDEAGRKRELFETEDADEGTASDVDVAETLWGNSVTLHDIDDDEDDGDDDAADDDDDDDDEDDDDQDEDGLLWSTSETSLGQEIIKARDWLSGTVSKEIKEWAEEVKRSTPEVKLRGLPCRRIRTGG